MSVLTIGRHSVVVVVHKLQEEKRNDMFLLNCCCTHWPRNMTHLLMLSDNSITPTPPPPQLFLSSRRLQSLSRSGSGEGSQGWKAAESDCSIKRSPIVLAE